MRKYIIMGPQGSGKGTQAKMLASDFDLVHISVGDIFRWHVQSRTKLGTKVQRYMKEGRLVPDEMVSDVVKWRLEIHDWRCGFVLDGFPRNAAQTEFFLENYDIDAVISIELPEQAAIERMQSRRLCSSCGLDYNLIQLRPKVPDVCDNCGGRLVTAARRHARRDPPPAQGLPGEDPAHPRPVEREGADRPGGRHADARRGPGRHAAQAGPHGRDGRALRAGRDGPGLRVPAAVAGTSRR